MLDRRRIGFTRASLLIVYAVACCLSCVVLPAVIGPINPNDANTPIHTPGARFESAPSSTPGLHAYVETGEPTRWSEGYIDVMALDSSDVATSDVAVDYTVPRGMRIDTRTLGFGASLNGRMLTVRFSEIAPKTYASHAVDYVYRRR